MLGMISLRMSNKKEERINSERINDGHLQNIDKWKKRMEDFKKARVTFYARIQDIHIVTAF